jgi:hypothetical protein
MLIVDPTDLLTASSGSVGETVFSRNQHGPYTRDRTVPTDPQTLRQRAVRNIFGVLSTAWCAELTETERQGWDAFALAVRTRTALGRSTNAGGLGTYIGANVPRIQALVGGSPRVDQAPTLYTAPPVTSVTRIVLNIVDDTIHPFFDPTDAWASELDAAMLFYVSAPRPLTVNFWKGPYRLTGKVLGGSPPPSSPATLAIPIPAGPDERVFVRARVTTADGRLSSSIRVPADIVPQVAPLYVGAVPAFIPPATFTLQVTFNALIRDQVHDPTAWLFRWNDRLFFPTSAVTHGNAVLLTAPFGGVNVGLDVVRYNPTTPDVFGLLTGIAVADFTLPF